MPGKTYRVKPKYNHHEIPTTVKWAVEERTGPRTWEVAEYLTVSTESAPAIFDRPAQAKALLKALEAQAKVDGLWADFAATLENKPPQGPSE